MTPKGESEHLLNDHERERIGALTHMADHLDVIYAADFVAMARMLIALERRIERLENPPKA